MPAPILHVIYAGRGDAMILECDDLSDTNTNKRNFILVDGGPRNYLSTSDSHVAPYHRYLVSACQQIMGQNISFAGIIFSHPDEDHYGGYLHAIDETQNMFTNNVFVPSPESDEDEVNASIATACVNAGLWRAVLHPQNEPHNYLIPPVKAIFPIRPAITWYRGNTERPNGDDLQYNTGLTENGRSILMYTVTPNSSNKMGIFFTGDSHADTISGCMRSEFPVEENRKFAIYKIQHHGALGDNMKAFHKPRFSLDIKRISFLYLLHKIRLGTAYLPTDISIHKTAFHAGQLLYTEILPEQARKKYFSDLERTVNYIKSELLQNVVPTGYGQTAIDLPDGYPSIYPEPKDVLDRLDGMLDGPGGKHQEQWIDLRDSHANTELMTYLHVRSVLRFYSSFVADVYVVSANYRYFHPRAEVLVGLALAVKGQDRKARLYVTNGESINIDELVKVAKVMGKDSVKSLFYGNHLRVSFLKNETYMSLDGASKRTIDRDMNKATVEMKILSNVDHQLELRSELSVLLEGTDPSHILLTKEYQMLCFVNNSLYYLYLELENNRLKWKFSHANDPRSVWIDGKELVFFKKFPFEIKCRAERFGIHSKTVSCQMSGVFEDQEFYFMGNLRTGEHLHETDGGIGYSKNPSGFKSAVIHFKDLSAQFQLKADLRMPDPPGLKVNTAGRVGTSLVPGFNFLKETTASRSEHSLRQAFEILNDPIKEKVNPNMIETLSRLYRDKEALVLVMERLPEMLLKIGFTTFEVDLDASTATIDSHPLQGRVIGSASLRQPKAEGGKNSPIEIEMAGFAFQLNDIVVCVDKCCSKQAYLTVVAEAHMKRTGLNLKMEWDSTEKETIISFSSSVVAIKDVIIALVSTEIDAQRILQGNIPLTTTTPAGEPGPSLGSMTGPVHEVGFSLSQPFGQHDMYDLESIWVRTQFTDWKSFLPIPEKSKEVRGEVFLRILNPLDPKSWRIAATVQLAMPVPSKPPIILAAQFKAIPLTKAGEYDYRFRITSASYGVTVPDIVELIGLSNLADKMNSIPVLSDVLNSVQVREAGISVEKVKDEWKFREWDVDLEIPVLELLPRRLYLVDTLVRVESFGKDEVQVKGEATFRSEILQKEAKVSLGLPTERDMGYIIISSPNSITLADIFFVFGLDELPEVPFLEGNTAIRLSYCDARFKKPKDGPITMLASTAKFRVKELVVEPFNMQDIEVSVSWQRGKENNTGSAVSFELSALLLNINSVITVKYDGGKKKMTASITPMTGSPMKVADVLRFLIRGVDSPLHSALASLEIKSVEMSLDVSTGSPSSFKLEMKNGATLQLPSATDTDSFTVGSITVEYSKVSSKLDVFAGFMIEGVQTNISLATLTNPTTKDRSVEFAITLQKGKRELGLMALLAAVGINDVKIPRPEGCPEFTIGVASIKGKFVDKDKLGLKFAELDVHVEMASVTLSDWDMSMDYIYVDVDYNKARTEKPFSVLVSSRFTIAGSAEMTIDYADNKEALELDAKLHHVKEGEELKIKSILKWLAGESIEDALPTFVSEAAINLENSKFGMSLSRHKGEGNSVIAVSLSITLKSVTLQLARTRTRPDDAKKEDKLPWKTLLKLAVNTLPRPPPLPLIGQMEQPFSTQIYWTNSDISLGEVDKLNTLTTFKDHQLLRSTRATAASAFGQGLSFMLLENGDVILASKPRKSKKKDDPSGKMMVILEEEENPEAPEMKKVNKRVNGVNITNIGLEYDAKRQRIKVKFTARMTVGPFDGELINFSMSVNLPRGEKIDLSNWDNLDIDMGLDGLSLAMTGSSLNVAGTLHRIKVEEEDISVTGFEGGVSVKLKKYQFVGFGSYKNVKSQQEEFVSLMAYAMLNGPMVKTGLVELSGISGGFGFGSKLEIPSITDIHKFPLLGSPEVDPMIMFERLRGTGDTKYMTETNGANWVAAGVTGTACELIDIRAVLTIPLDPSAGELAIVGIASAQFPRDAKPGKALAAIRINFQGSIDISRGFMLFEGRIADGSFILFDDCVLSGGFAVGAWFGPSPQAGDWCITIGGWHPKFQAPSHYPSAPPRMRLQWSYGDTKYLTLDGQAYAAVTPDAIMAGLAVQVKFEKWSCGANFDFRTDLILWLHPLHYDVYFHVSASLWYEVDAWIARKKLHISMGADLYISGPPFAGTVEFDVSVMVIKVKFGDHRVQDKALEFDEFMSIVLKNDKFSHVFSLESGGVVPTQAPTEAQTPDSTWIVRGGSLAFSIVSRMPTSRIEFTGAKDHERKTGERILARPMQLPATSAGFKANMDVSVTNNSGSLVHGFTFEIIYEQLPKSLWGPFNSNPNNMLYGASESTVTHATGLSIQAPMARWSSDNPRVIQFSKVGRSEPVHASFNNDPTRDNGLDAKPRANEENPEAEFENAREALMGSNKRVEELEAVKKRNARRSYIVDQWMGIRKLKSPASLRSDVPLRYAKDLAHFSHVAPRVSLE
ncbi:hypothetical protein FNAPI_5581 [Fusarium napiforme]|uniref:DUF6603 domain-containing protein n=1 Tax=Fusarium napiforme TaxID=42672 RepID=A0A8H5N9Q5_9HYPO|nr:hypothetical protein FNAPI_5581 [Fusarium napiforme]